jgi:hypothetical protein
MALRPCRECKAMVSTSATTCPRCGVPSPYDLTMEPKRRKFGLKVFLALVGLAILRLAFSGPPGSNRSAGDPSANTSAPILLLGKPTFTKDGAPFCATKEGLADLLEHVRAGLKGIANGEYGCVAMPADIPVTVLETDGIVDRWAKVNWQRSNGTNDDFWTVAWLLRN